MQMKSQKEDVARRAKDFESADLVSLLELHTVQTLCSSSLSASPRRSYSLLE